MSNIDKQILGLNPEEDYSKVDLRKTYHKLAKKYHPDKYLTTQEKKSAHEMFQVVSSAYTRLSGEKVDTDVNVMPSLHEIISPQGLFGAFEKAKKFMDENVQEAFVLNGSLSKESPDFIIMSLFDNPDEKYSFDNIMSDTISEQDEDEEKPTNLIDSIVNEGSDHSDTTLTETEEMSSRKKKHKKRKHRKHKRRSRRD